MDNILSKKQMSEEDIKLQYITPAIQSRWNTGSITMEQRVKLTDGKINIRGNLEVMEKPKYADYILYLTSSTPIAVVEAKDNSRSVSYGLQQAMTYARMMDIPFAYSSNGDGFAEHDFLTGRERELSLSEFPGPDELKERCRREANGGKGLTPDEEKIIRQPFYASAQTYPPRYYQRSAVNRTLDAIARGQKRLLLVMATGTGKTYTAFQIVYRLLKTGMVHRVLYLADRNILVDQSIQQDFAPLEKVTHKISVSKDSPEELKSYQVYFSLYQQLLGDDDVEHYSRLFRPDFFDLVIVDECHRGSAKEDSRWRRILEYFSSACQIGMTATPRETKYTSNISYFGEPVYQYSLRQGIDDGFLAPFRVINITMDISDGWRPLKGQRDINGQEIEDRIYTNSDYDYNIVLQDRIDKVADEITDYLRTTGRMQKTIVFCPTEEAAERMRIALNNKNADMVRKNPDYVVRITGSDAYGKSKLSYFISVTLPYPVIAVTSDLLSTGVDSKMTQLIVIDKMINSMTEFKQIIGRGTRLRREQGKTHFTIMDFRGVTRLFADPDWDGPVEQVKDFTPGSGIRTGQPHDPLPPADGGRPKPIIDQNGCRVEITNKKVSVYDAGGKLVRTENIIDYTRRNILGQYASLQSFISRWTSGEKKEKITAMFREQGIDLEKIKAEQNMQDVDDFDFICHVAYDRKPLTRRERADSVKKKDFFSRYSGPARRVLELLLDAYKDSGICEIEKTRVLTIPALSALGTPSRIIGYFGGEKGYFSALKELEQAIYSSEAS